VLLTVRLLNEGSPSSTAGVLDRFVGEWRHMKTAVTGHDLRRMNLPAGPLYSRLLERLLDARLDGEVQNESDERALLARLLAADSKDPSGDSSNVVADLRED
jgi:tRNA nucleotidyltransferase (CCA-adding enzyme)